MIQNAMDEKVFAWHPDGAVSKQSRLASFMKLCGLDSYDAFYQYSINNIPRFTSQVLDFLNIQFDKAYSQILDLSAGLPWAHWCIGGSLNISRSCLDQHIDSPRAAAPAIIWEGEEGASRILTYAELFEMVENCAAGLRALGLGHSDAIGLHLPMMPETVAALLAVARIGAVASPLFSGYGPAAIESRLRDVGAKALFTCDAFPRHGAAIPAYATAAKAVEKCPETIKTIIVVDHAGNKVSRQAF